MKGKKSRLSPLLEYLIVELSLITGIKTELINLMKGAKTMKPLKCSGKGKGKGKGKGQ